MSKFNIPSSAALSMVKSILSVTQPNLDIGAAHEGNWPASAEFAVDYTDKDRQFPEVRHSRNSAYFESEADFKEWVAKSKIWIKGTDYDFSRTYSLYSWDLGPVLLGTHVL